VFCRGAVGVFLGSGDRLRLCQNQKKFDLPHARARADLVSARGLNGCFGMWRVSGDAGIQIVAQRVGEIERNPAAGTSHREPFD
jgi:hypothetical protein